MKNICFTSYNIELINRTKQQWDQFCIDNRHRLGYLIFQHETCPKTERVHIQGYCELKRSIRLPTVKNMFGDKTLHIEPRKGSQEDAVQYSCKDDTAIPETQYEWGLKMISQQGERTDVAALMELANDPSLSIKDIKDSMPVEWCKYHKAVDRARAVNLQHSEEQKMIAEFANCDLRIWQEELLLELKEPPDDRTIRWIVDTTGNAGKTWFAKWAAVNLDAQVIANGKTSDIARAYQHKSIVILNLARTPEQYVNYQVMENIKDGLIWSPKYEPLMKYFKPPHLIVMANQWPEYNKVSLDRWNISELKNGILSVTKREIWPIFAQCESRYTTTFN